MEWTGTDVLIQNVIDALRFDLNCGGDDLVPGSDDLATYPGGEAMEPLSSKVDRVLRYDGPTDIAHLEFAGAGWTGRTVYVGFADMQQAGPILSDSNPLRAALPLEVGIMQLVDDASQFEPLHFELDRVMDDVLRTFHRKRRRPSDFGAEEMVFLTSVRSLESLTEGFTSRNVVVTLTRDARNLFTR